MRMEKPENATEYLQDYFEQRRFVGFVFEEKELYEKLANRKKENVFEKFKKSFK